VPAEFVALSDLLRPPDARAVTVDPPMIPPVPPEGSSCEPFDDEPAADVVAAARDARLFRARLADAFGEAAARLLRELAAEVLARELRLAPSDLAELVRRVRERAPVVRVRVAQDDTAAFTDVPVVADPALERGDAVIELAGGVIDARLGVRLATVLEVFA
jgi:hypothetical protein